jgi:hypothetical protein
MQITRAMAGVIALAVAVRTGMTMQEKRRVGGGCAVD